MKWLKNLLLPPPVLVQVWCDRIVASEIGGSNRVECGTVVTIEANPSRNTELIAGFGNELQPSGLADSIFRTVNPFGHPHAVMDDFETAGHLLKHVLRQLFPNRLIRISPRLVIQPMDEYATDLSEMERRALLELGFAAGARKVVVWQGGALDAERAETLFAAQA